ncbi:MAG: high-potential iron-sulfur protein [Rhodanobacter sp.]
MTDPLHSLISRRAVLRRMLLVAGAAVSLPLWARATSTKAATADVPEAFGTADKAALQYQDHPKGTSACANCANFIPGKTAKDAGHCTIVTGSIDPNAWCLAYAGAG